MFWVRYLEDEGDEFISHTGGDHLGFNLHNCDNNDILIYRVIFSGPPPKRSKYGTGPPQQEKMTKFTGDGKNPY